MYWAQRKAFSRIGGQNLGLHYRGVEIRWFGKRGMSWYDFAATVEKEIKLLPPPSYLIIQLGSNDLGKGKSCGLIVDIKRDIGRIRLLLPNTRIIWSEILLRRYWHVAKGDGKIIEKIRKRVNCAVNNFIKNEGHYVIKHSNIRASEIELYRFDGTHLSDIGNDIYLNNLQGALETFITSPNTKSFPVANI